MVAATAAYFAFCQKVHRRVVMPAGGEAGANGRGHANDADDVDAQAQDLLPPAASHSVTHHLCRSLSALMQLHRALAKALSGSLLIWIDAIVKQLNGISRCVPLNISDNISRRKGGAGHPKTDFDLFGMGMFLLVLDISLSLRCRVCTTRPVLACRSAGSTVLVNECMLTLSQFTETYVASVLSARSSFSPLSLSFIFGE